MSHILNSLILILFWMQFFYAQKTHIETIAFYNVENLFDTIDNPDTYDEEYTPEGSRAWTEAHLTQKIDHIAHVIVKIGAQETTKAPLMIGLSEIENRFVLEKLISHPKMKPYGYKILHFDSRDNRGIDVALLYRESLFTVAAVKTYPLWLSHPKRQARSPSRDQLVVTGYWGELELGILVNHWPSRRGGIKISEPARIKAAQLQQKILDSLQRTNPESYLVSMGDFNDNPTNQSLRLLSQKSSYFEYYKPLYNPMLKLFKKGIGSLAYRDRWFLFDQILVSSNWLTQNGGVLLKPAVFNPKFLTTPEGRYSGYPYRTQITGTLLFGYSDHYPVYIVIGKE